jgi:hypothetical protein
VADHVDLAPPPHRKGENEFQRPLLTTTDDLAGSAEQARAGGRRLSTSLLLNAVVVCDASEIRGEEEALCERVGLPWRALDDCPYVLLGPTERIAEQVRVRRERIGLDWLIVPSAQVEPFAGDVMPLLT